MHILPLHLGDYAAATAHLTDIEDLAYRRALDRSYLTEQPLPADPEEVARLLRMREHVAAVTTILHEFFEPSPAGWRHARVEREIAKVEAMRLRNTANGRKGGRKPRGTPEETDSEPSGLPTGNPVGSSGLPNNNPPQRLPFPVPRTPLPVTSVLVPRTGAEAPADTDPEVDAVQAEAPPARAEEDELWRVALPALTAQAMSERSARGYIGRTVRDYGVAETLRLFRTAVSRRVVDIPAYVAKAGQRLTAADATRDDPKWAKEHGFPNRWEAENAGVK